MAKAFKLPDLGEGIHEAQIVNVMIKQGDRVTEDQMVMEVETDKASVELPVPYAGLVTQLNVEIGQTVTVGDVLLVVEEVGAAADAAKRKGQPAPSSARKAPVSASPARRSAPQTVSASRPATGSPAMIAEPRVPGRGPVPAAPSVRRLARESGVDLRQVHGTGPGGRIVREDVERTLITAATGGGVATPPPMPAEQPKTIPAPTIPAAKRTASSPGSPSRPSAPTRQSGEALPDFSQWGPIRREKISQIRKTIARQMFRAWSTIPHVTHGDEADVTDLETFRKEHGKVMAAEGVKLTLTTFILKAVAGALREFPQLNASFDEAASEIIYKDYVHIGVAVDSPRGLMVPVLRDVDQKGLLAISRELRQIGDRAREFKLDVSEMRGGTFTVTNVGVLGGTFLTPMINAPEVAILGLGKLAQKPMVRDGQIVPRMMLPLFLSFDHRVVDGADGARFLKAVMTYLENPLNLLLAS